MTKQVIWKYREVIIQHENNSVSRIQHGWACCECGLSQYPIHSKLVGLIDPNIAPQCLVPHQVIP